MIKPWEETKCSLVGQTLGLCQKAKGNAVACEKWDLTSHTGVVYSNISNPYLTLKNQSLHTMRLIQTSILLIFEFFLSVAKGWVIMQLLEGNFATHRQSFYYQIQTRSGLQKQPLYRDIIGQLKNSFSHVGSKFKIILQQLL